MLSFPSVQAEKYPAVVIMHGSGGVSEHETSLAKELNARGLATLAMDWFTGRGVSNSTADPSKVGFPSTAVDLLMAYKVLAANPKIDGSRIGAAGFSRAARPRSRRIQPPLPSGGWVPGSPLLRLRSTMRAAIDIRSRSSR
ncbi:MAG TPA: dienelactone hydrolase family protein [Ferrovibrio sp.]|uniref:dienelactone hydrolase family protein n=1 Tax=Ferrovibrio sp. TaxID=1917215 RepID=UPI002ED01E6E